MLAAAALSTLLAVSPASSSRDDASTKQRTGTIVLAMLPVSFAAFAGLHTFGYSMRQDRIPCYEPPNERAALAFRAVVCIGVPGKFELVGAGAPMTLAAIGSNALASAHLLRGGEPWRRRGSITAVTSGAALIAGGFATVIVSLVAEGPVLRGGEGWGWPLWQHIAVAQSGAVLMAAGGALVGTGAAHLQAARPRTRATVRFGAAWSHGPGLVASGRF
ncbi:MAG: hypothetical protein AAGA54_33745 [Myxococcota bacterium]